MTLQEEATGLERLLVGRVVTAIRRNRASEIVVEFDDGSRLLVDASSELSLSVT